MWRHQMDSSSLWRHKTDSDIDNFIKLFLLILFYFEMAKFKFKSDTILVREYTENTCQKRIYGSGGQPICVT